MAESSDSDASSLGSSIAIDASLSHYRALERGASAAMWAVRIGNTHGSSNKAADSKGSRKLKDRQKSAEMPPDTAPPKTARETARERRARAAALRAQNSKNRPSSARR